MLWIQHRLPWITEQRLCIDHGYSGIVVAFWTCTCFGLLLRPVWFQIPSTISSPCSSCMVSIQLVVAVREISARAPEVWGLVGFASKCLDRGTDTRVWGIYDLICIRLGFPFFSSEDFVWRSTSRCIWCHYFVGSKCLTLPSCPPPPSRGFFLGVQSNTRVILAQSNMIYGMNSPITGDLFYT